MMEILRFFAPDAMAGLPAPEPLPSRKEGQLDANGLRIQCPGFLLDTSDRLLEAFAFSTLNEPTVAARGWTAINNGKDCMIYFVRLHLEHVDAKQRSRIKELALVLRNSISDASRIGYTDEHGCVLANARVVDNEIHGEYVCRAYVTWGLADGSNETVLRMFQAVIQMGPKLALTMDEGTPGVAAVERYDVDQRWCVS